jgi:hypothetical protein
MKMTMHIDEELLEEVMADILAARAKRRQWILPSRSSSGKKKLRAYAKTGSADVGGIEIGSRSDYD